jgi:hypothetical protein
MATPAKKNYGFVEFAVSTLTNFFHSKPYMRKKYIDLGDMRDMLEML